MTDYNKKAASVAAKFKKDGQPSILRRIVLGEYDPGTGLPAVLSDTCYPCWVMCFDYELQGGGVGYSPESLIQIGDKQILLPAGGLPITPAPGDLLIAGGEVIGGTPENGGLVGGAVVGGELWTLNNVKTISPIGIAVLHELNGRR